MNQLCDMTYSYDFCIHFDIYVYKYWYNKVNYYWYIYIIKYSIFNRTLFGYKHYFLNVIEDIHDLSQQ